MPFDNLLGAGREPRAIPILRKYSKDQTGTNMWGVSGQTETVSFPITDEAVQIFAFQVSISPTDSNGTTGSAVNPTFEIRIDGNTISKYSLPQEGTDAALWTITEMVPYNFVAYGGANVQIVTTNSSVGGNGYNCNWNVTAFGVLI